MKKYKNVGIEELVAEIEALSAQVPKNRKHIYEIDFMRYRIKLLRKSKDETIEKLNKEIKEIADYIEDIYMAIEERSQG